MKLYEVELVEAIQDFARSLSLEPGNEEAQKYLCWAHEELKAQSK